MAPPSADQYPAEHPATLSMSLSQHPDHLFDSAPNAKTRKAQGLAGFGPGGFLPLTFLLRHKQKNKSRTFWKKIWGADCCQLFLGVEPTQPARGLSPVLNLRLKIAPLERFLDSLSLQVM